MQEGTGSASSFRVVQRELRHSHEATATAGKELGPAKEKSKEKMEEGEQEEEEHLRARCLSTRTAARDSGLASLGSSSDARFPSAQSLEKEVLQLLKVGSFHCFGRLS